MQLYAWYTVPINSKFLEQVKSYKYVGPFVMQIIQLN
jgi:hypothetical protein